MIFADQPDAAETTACDALTAERRIAARQELLMMARAIQGLPRRGQQVFILSRLHGLANGDIATQLRISRNMVEKHIMRALLTCRALQRELKRE